MKTDKPKKENTFPEDKKISGQDEDDYSDDITRAPKWVEDNAFNNWGERDFGSLN